MQWWQWALGALAIFFTGMAKSGILGLMILVVPLILIVAGDARQAVAWLLPSLILADILGIIFFGRHTKFKELFRLVPGVYLGMALGAVALSLPEKQIRIGVVTIIFCMLAAYLIQSRKKIVQAPTDEAVDKRGGFRFLILLKTGGVGAFAGLTTTVANAAGPIMSLYLLQIRLTKHAFVGTAAWFFLIVNTSKIPIYYSHGLFSRASMLFFIFTLPALFCGALAGRKIVNIIPQKIFNIIILSLTVVASLLLLFQISL